MLSALIVEANAAFRKILANLLAYQFPRMVLDEAASGEEALEKIRDCLPDLVFVDIKLQGDNGLELTRQIKKNYPETIVIIFSSYDLPEYREAATQYGANYFISKVGVSTAIEVLELVQSILSNMGRPKENHEDLSKGENI